MKNVKTMKRNWKEREKMTSENSKRTKTLWRKSESNAIFPNIAPKEAENPATIALGRLLEIIHIVFKSKSQKEKKEKFLSFQNQKQQNILTSIDILIVLRSFLWEKKEKRRKERMVWSVRVQKVVDLYRTLYRASNRLKYTDKEFYLTNLRANFREKPKDFEDFKLKYEAGVRFSKDLGGLM